MSHKLFKHSFILFCIAVAQPAFAQTQDFETKANRENAPYSRFGIGEFKNGINPAMKAMGGSNAAYSDPYTLNTDNPASYASLKNTTYEGSLVGSQRTVISGTDKYRTGMASINHLSIGVPMGKYAGMSLGFRPMTHIYYRLSDTAVIPAYGNSVRTFYGDGSLNYAFVGLAGKYKGFSLGANVGYLFGSTVYSNLLESIDNSQNVNDASFSRVLRTGGIYWKAGAQYTAPIGKMFLSVGATMSANQAIKTDIDEFWLSYNFSGRDTSYASLGQKGTLTMPMMYSAGIQLADSNQWRVGVDFSAADWSNYSGAGRADSVTGGMSYKIAAGGEFTPDADAMRKYFNRVSYRLGFYYGTDYVYLRNTPMNYYAVTFGFGLPFKKVANNRFVGKLNMAFEVGSRGAEVNGLPKENFFKTTVGINLSDAMWFIKRKYD